jgi:excisionase family DNA binding protein
MAGFGDWLLTKEAAYQLGISVSCMNRRAVRGTIRSRLVGNQRLFHAEDVAAAKAVREKQRENRRGRVQ